MATKIRRSLYIGLGGTGMKALLHTKKMFIDTYGEVPPMVGFIGIDTDGGEYSKSLKSVRGEEVRLTPNEQLQLLAPDAVDFYYNHKQDFSWVPQCNINAIPMLRGEGAGGVRSNGRFAFTINKNRADRAIRDKIDQITDAEIVNNDKYELLANNLPEVHLVFSICGGTGCGSFINMAYLLKEINVGLKVTGYAVLPGAFDSLAACAHVKPNTYGALFDLDYLMHHGINNTPIDIKYLNSKYCATTRPFTNVFFIDNKNARNDNYGAVDSISEMISLALITAAGELSVAGASVGDNFSIAISMGTLDIINKKAWASGMGACEIVYRGNELAEIYRMKAVQNIIMRLQSPIDDTNIIANGWIDSAEVKIRENNGQNDLTDYIGDITPKYPLNINNPSDPTNEVERNIDSNKLDSDELERRVQDKLDATRTELRNLIVKQINREGGVAAAKSIMSELKSQIDVCYSEMVNEKETLSENESTLRTVIANLINDIKSNSGLFGRSRREKSCHMLSEKTRELNECIRDKQRHEAAITFYTSFLNTIDEYNEKVKAINSLLESVKESLTGKIAKLQNGISKESSIFQINLAHEDVKHIAVKEAEIVISDMLKTLNGENKIYGFAEYATNEIEKFFMDYAQTLSGAKEYLEKGVEEALKTIYDNNPAEFAKIINLASRKSQALFQYNHKGHAPRQNMTDMIYVGVEDKDSSILSKDDLFERSMSAPDGLNTTRNVAFASTGMKDKIIIYNQIGVVPIYALKDIEVYKDAYIHTYNKPEGHHFDDDLRLRIEHEDFQLRPQQEYDANDVIDLWINGFIFGLLKNENGKYQIKCRALGKALDGYWVSLGSAYRNEAFESFKRHEATITREFRQYFDLERQRRGEEAMNMLINDVKLNYLENYSQIKLDRRTLDGHGYEKVTELLEMELRYIEENL